MSLLYIFWSYPRADVETSLFAGRLSTFRVTLAKQIGGNTEEYSASFTSETPPWLPQGVSAFSDWWVMDNSQVLDYLNDGAVASNVKPSHDKIAELYGGGAGSLYDVKSGGTYLPKYSKYTHWFAKPKGMSYDDFYKLMAEVLKEKNAYLLRRRMVLGPSPEFCVASETKLTFPAAISGVLTLTMKQL